MSGHDGAVAGTSCVARQGASRGPVAVRHRGWQRRRMRIRALSCLAISLTSCLAAAPALACTVISTGERSPAEKRREARLAIERATAVIDGEVVRPLARDGRPALVRAARVLKGPARDYFEVGERHSCDVPLTRAGERLRLILVGGPDLYFLPDDYSNARYEDRILRSDRRRVWPYRQGGSSSD